MERNILARAAEFLRKSTRHKRWRRAFTGMAAVVVFITSYMMILPAITMTVNQGALPPGVNLDADPDYTAELTLSDGSVVTIGVYDPEGNVPEGAELVAELFEEDSEDYLKAEDTLLNSEDVEPYDGMLAMDLHFEDADGNEVEPTGSVYVDMEADALLPANVDPESVAVQHHVELDADRFFGLVDGSETTVEVVADGSENTGDIVVDPTESPAPSETPAVTETPEVTETPATTESPEVTETPAPEETPAESGEVDLPEETTPTTDAPVTDSPVVSTLPEVPESPEPPVTPEEPSTLPELPSEPVAPVEPETPSEPEAPVESTENTTEPAESTEDSTAVEATFAVDSFSTFTITWNVLEEVPEEPELICGLEEHSHFEDCYDADGNLICTIPEHTHTEDCYAVELPEEEIPMGGFPEELPEGYVPYEFTNEDGLSVLAYAPEDAFGGQEVTLFAEVLAEDSDEYAQAQANLDASDAVGDYDGMVAMDIRFQDADGKEVEPDAEAGPVYVDIRAEALIPEDVDTSTLAVQHHAETTDGGLFGTGIFAGTEVTVETVADANTETGTITAVPAEASIPETLPALADEPMTEEIATLEEPAEEETEEPAAVPMDVEASFGVESFSYFTITWGSGWQSQSVSVYYVDTNGSAIDGRNYREHDSEFNVTFNSDSWVSMTWYADTIDNYQYQYARLNDATSGKIISQLYYGDNTWKYKVPGSDEEYTLSYSYYKPTVYLVYKSGTGVSQFTTADTVDHIEKGVHMYMFDYGGTGSNVTALFGPGSDSGTYYYGDGTTKEGMLNARTNEYGWPTMKVKVGTTTVGSSFASVFAKNHIGTNALAPTEGAAAYEVNKLFLKDAYDYNGDFYFNSAEYFATLVGGVTNEFTVYDQLGTPNDQNYFFYQRGNFMPYNTLTKTIANYNLYNDDGTLKTEEDDRLGEPVYETNGTNYQFGMYMFANFYQPENGQVETSTGTKEDMIFEFTGDDDMWVFIDGVLVLDIGGVHDAQSGYINFTDGTVNWTDTPKSSTRYNNVDYSYPTSEVIWHNPGSTPSTTDTPTTLKDIYTNVGMFGKFDWNGDTFQDGSTHTIQVFYMERGSGASNLKMRFNLKTIPDGTLAVTKDVDNYYSGQMKDLEYTMQVKVDGVVYSRQKYYILGQESQKLETDENGCFNLKHDQTAIFEGIEVGTKVEVEEVDMPSLPEGVSLEDQYDITYVVKDAVGNLIQGENIEMPGYGSVNVTVTNTAKFTRPLVVKKVFNGTDDQVPQGFEATFSLYEVTRDGDELIDTVKYSEFTDGQFVFWLETDKSYKVTETFVGGDNTGATETLAYVGNSASDTDWSNAAGIVALDVSDSTEIASAETITITNRYGEPSGDLSITKKVEYNGLDTYESNAVFEFDVVLSNSDFTGTPAVTYTNVPNGVTWPGDSQPTTVSFSAGEATVYVPAGATITIEGLPAAATAEITETEASRAGYAVSWEGGTATDNGTKTATVTTAQISTNPAVTCTNTTGAVLPSTGGMGVAPYLTFGSLLTLGAGLLLLQRRRKEGSDAV